MGRRCSSASPIFAAAERRRYERNLMAAKSAAERERESDRASGDLREQFIAVLGHDLRNPLAAVAGGVRLLRKETDPEARLRLLDLMDASLARASRLIEDVMDFARGRLGGGIR